MSQATKGFSPENTPPLCHARPCLGGAADTASNGHCPSSPSPCPDLVNGFTWRTNQDAGSAHQAPENPTQNGLNNAEVCQSHTWDLGADGSSVWLDPGLQLPRLMMTPEARWLHRPRLHTAHPLPPPLEGKGHFFSRLPRRRWEPFSGNSYQMPVSIGRLIFPEWLREWQTVT